MDLLIVPVPLFNDQIAVEAYYFRHRKGNDIIESSKGNSQLDGAMISPALEMLNTVSVEALTMDKPIFIPITHYMLLTSLERQTNQPPERIIFLLDSDASADEDCLKSIRRLKKLGFRFAIQKIVDMDVYEPILELCDYIFYDHRIFDHPQQVKLRVNVSHRFKHIISVYTHLKTMEEFNLIKARYHGLYEGPFYRMPITKGDHEVSPLQVNLIQLLNTVRDENFEFEKVAETLQKDPSLTVALLRLVNSVAMGLREKIKSINQAVVMLGQDEIRKWITTAVAKLLGAERPDEITRTSLIRARFAENLAPKFGLAQEADSLFLMGLFSVLDAILEIPMDEALKKVRVADEIYEALVEQKGEYYPVYEFMLLYESAYWNTVSRMMILHDFSTEEIYQAYLDALIWYRDLIRGDAG